MLTTNKWLSASALGRWPLITGNLTLKCVGTLTKCQYTAGGRSRRGSPKAGTTVVRFRRMLVDVWSCRVVIIVMNSLIIVFSSYYIYDGSLYRPTPWTTLVPLFRIFAKHRHFQQGIKARWDTAHCRLREFIHTPSIRLFANDVIMIGSVRADWPAPFSVTIGNPRADKLGRNGFECIGRRCLVDRERCVRATFMHSAIENYSMLHLQRWLECRGIKRFGTKSLFMIISHNCQSCMCRQ